MVLLHIKPTDLHIVGSLDWMNWWLSIFIVFVGGQGPARGWLSDAYIFLSGIYPDFIRFLSGILCMRTWAAKPPNMLGWGWPGLGWLGWVGLAWLGWVGLGWATFTQ